MKTERAITIIHALCKDNKHDDATSFLQWYISHLGRVEHPTTSEKKLAKKAEKLGREKNIITLSNGIEIDVNDNWNPRSGGACPVDGSAKVKVMFRNGEQGEDIAKNWDWGHCKSVSDIIAYRVIQG